MTIALDAMGGDYGPKVVLPAALKALKKHKDLVIFLVGQEDVLKRYLRRLKADKHSRLRIKHASETVAMDEDPAQALRGKKDSSMRVAINMVKNGEARACVSAGNTGALMATARFVLKTLPGIDRPAIVSVFPYHNHLTHVLDLGANVDSSPDILFQFAIMGSILAAAASNIESPRVGLINVGTEQIKGNEQVKQAAQLLERCDAINYVGYVEGSDFFKDTADVIVCDGFVGNVALKTIEGLAKYVRDIMLNAFKKNLFTKFCGLIASPILLSLKKYLNPDRYNGASLLGLNGIVVKSHGGASVLGFYHAIEEAVLELEKEVPERIREQLASIMLTEQQDEVQ